MFLLAFGYRKNFYSASFLQALDPDGVVFDASCFTVQGGQSLTASVATASGVNVPVLVDPVNYYDQSPKDARPKLYEELPYGQKGRRAAPPQSAQMASYAAPIIDYQLAQKPLVVIAPYFYAEPGGLGWFDASLDLAVAAAQYVHQKPSSADVWAGAALSATVLTTPAARNHVVAKLKQRKPKTLYLLVAATQATAAPLADKETILGLREVVETVNANGGRVVIGRRYVSGYLARASGAAGWSTGISGTHQNFPPPPAAKKKDGGQGADWIFLPPLLNSVRLQTRATLVASNPSVATPTDQFDTALFQGNPTRVTLTTAQRILLHQHNLLALRNLDRALSNVAAGQRRAAAKVVVQNAEATYAGIARTWIKGEGPAFLDAWLKAL